jgi:hypothetical protein
MSGNVEMTDEISVRKGNLIEWEISKYPIALKNLLHTISETSPSQQ